MYDDYNDNELIYLIYDFNEDANRILHEKYYKIIQINPPLPSLTILSKVS